MPRFVLLATIFALVLLAQASADTGFAGAPPAGLLGDADCSEAVNPVDSLTILRGDGGLAQPPCANLADVQCDGDLDPIDSLQLLRWDAGLSVNQQPGCEEIGSPLGPLTVEDLTERLSEATADGQAEALLRRMYPEIDVGLYTAAGEPIIPGGETGIDDFYLYDFESDLLAGSFVDGLQFRLDTATLYLGKAGIIDPGTSQPYTDEGLLSYLAAKVTAARADESQYTWRLIDELGLAREDPLDLTDPTLEPESVFLDPVQTFLILYDMTLGLTGATRVSGEAGPVASPSAATKALHDYSFAAQSYLLLVYPPAPTHWKHEASSTAEERTLQVRLVYGQVEEPVVALAGPLAGLDQNDVLGDLYGLSVDWKLGDLEPSNGTFHFLSNTLYTDDDGWTSIVFVPKTECAPGKGSVKTEHRKVYAEITTKIGDFFAPGNPQDVVTLRAPIKVDVSHHTGKARVSGPSVEGEPATCGDWHGTIKWTVDDSDENAYFVWTSVAEVYFRSDLEPGTLTCDTPDGDVPCEVYYASGTVETQYEQIVVNGCHTTMHASGVISSGPTDFDGALIVYSTDPPTYEGLGVTTVTGTTTSDCPHTGPYEDPDQWFAIPFGTTRPVSEDGTVIDDTYIFGSQTFEVHLEKVTEGCPASVAPEGDICGGP